MDRKYIIEHNLMEAHKNFMRLSEGYLAEVGDDDENDDQQQGMNPNQGMSGPDQGAPTGGNQGPDMNMGGGMPQDSMTGPQGDMQGQDPNIGMPQDDMGGDMPSGPDMGMDMGPEMPPEDMGAGEDDTVLDVDDLTNAQEKLNKKQNEIGKDLSGVDDRIMKLLTAVETIKGSLDRNNDEITALKAELEKRVPTEKEKLNMQSLKMYPYNTSPNDYWKEKEKEGRYKAQEDDKKPFNIKEKDIDDYSDSEIARSFDSELNQTMSDIFR